VRLVVIADVATRGETIVDEALALLEGLGEHAPRLRLVERDTTGTDDRRRLARLERLRRATRAAGVELIVSARVDLALAIEADGVQLPEAGLPAEVVRRAFPRLLVGRSCHDRAGLEAALAAGVDWAFLSPLHAPHSKVASVPALGLDGFARALAGLPACVYALGGVTPADVGPVLAAGGAGVATIGGVFGQEDPCRAALALHGVLGRG
jgi:thiamine-phosphate diphosphorylase